ncbi:MAG: FAD-dependent oxidoreductase [Leptolyngbya sp. SIO4C5]|nr:FAD-dependent oxidoreductase [Leptolyngbya sp. SIO4C5]
MKDAQNFEYDLLVVGAGSAGLSAAKSAAKQGWQVAIAEQDTIGGTCVNRGCVPKKLMVYAADVAQQQAMATGYGWVNPKGLFDWSALKQSMHQHIAKINQSMRSQLQEAGVTYLAGQAQFLDAHQLQVGDRTYSAAHVVIAVGARPTQLDCPGAELAITSRDMFTLTTLPKRIAIVGAGYIGVEFGSLLNWLDCEVTLLDVDDQILTGFDQDIRCAVQNSLTERGIRFIGGAKAKALEKTAQGLQLHLSNQTEALRTDCILAAIGRQPNLAGLGLEQAGVQTDSGAIAVDDYGCTSQAHIYAVGDCTRRNKPLTPVAKAEGEAVAQTLLGTATPIDCTCIPSAVFARPEAATVGLTEQMAADELGEAMQVRCQSFQPLRYSLTQQSEQGLVKMIVNQKSNQVVGLHVVGEHAADIVQGVAVAIRQGITDKALSRALGIHPTVGEEVLSL